MTDSNIDLAMTDLANAIRALSMDAVQKANSGHPGMPMGMADVATVLYSKFLKFNPEDPHWPDRDRFILSAGHGSMLLYSLLYLTGYEEMTLEQLKNFRQLGYKTCGHPEYGEAGGIETTTGPLGQGLANAVGMAIAEKMLSVRFGTDLVNHKTYVIAGDGCLMEGISQEAISLAGHLKLGKLIVLFDDNEVSIDGPTSLATSEDQIKRFEACNWHCQTIDGHNFEEIEKAIQIANENPLPSMIACKTTIAKGSPNKSGTAASHGAPLGEDEIEQTRKELGWNYREFEIPEDIMLKWRSFGDRCKQSYRNWKDNLNSISTEIRQEFARVISGEVERDKISRVSNDLKREFAEAEKAMATRKASGMSIEKFADEVPELIGGSADLTGSNNTKNDLPSINSENFAGRYIYYGVREHAMCAAMNGISLHGGFKPYGGTFFIFTDYCRPSIRLAALMGLPVIYIMTHDSIGLGEDGPTHQPVEHLASLRAMPNLTLLRPADAYETAEAWEIALKRQEEPSMLVLSRQVLANLHKNFSTENKSKKGAYKILDNGENPDLVLLSSGSEVELCVSAAEILKEKDIKANVISMPSWDLFEKQSEDYKTEILCDDSVPKIAVEAAVKFGWEKYIGRNGKFIGMDSFGASAPAKDLFKHFGITVENIIKQAEELVK